MSLIEKRNLEIKKSITLEQTSSCVKRQLNSGERIDIDESRGVIFNSKTISIS